MPGFAVRALDLTRDAAELVRMWRTSFEHGVGVTDAHPLAEQEAYFREQVAPRHRVQVAHDASGIVGFVAATPTNVGQLYVRVDRIGQGIGTTLLDAAKQESDGTLWLFTFARNSGALRFYAHQGFVEVARGFAPEWQLEDVRLEWRRGAGRASSTHGSGAVSSPMSWCRTVDRPSSGDDLDWDVRVTPQRPPGAGPSPAWRTTDQPDPLQGLHSRSPAANARLPPPAR